MCEPASIAMGVIAVASAVMTHRQQASNAKAAKDFQEIQDRHAQLAKNFRMNALARQETATRDAAAQDQFINQIEANKRVGTAAVVNEESGLSGPTLDSLIDDYYRQQGRIDDVSARNANMQVQAVRDEMDATNLQYEQRTTHAPIAEPSLAGLGLGIAKGVGEAWMHYDLRKERNKPPSGTPKG